MAAVMHTFTPSTATTMPLRVLTAAALFDGHDAAINIMRRLLQSEGCEVIHLGHNRSVDEIVYAALQEDVDAIAISSYQGGHLEFFRYLLEQLQQYQAADIAVFGGGGGTITAEEARILEAAGVTRIYLPEDGQTLGLVGMIRDLIAHTNKLRSKLASELISDGITLDIRSIGKILSAIERDPQYPMSAKVDRIFAAATPPCPVVGITGTGGAGKSTIMDELLQRFLQYFPDLHIAVIAIDPTQAKHGGALLGDRIRINSASHPRVFMRSAATHRRHLATSSILSNWIAFLKAAGFGLILIETAGVGQADTEIVEVTDHSVYVMTTDYGGPGQLEKIAMLDYADIVVLNKIDRFDAVDALRQVRQQWRRNHRDFAFSEEQIPVYPTIANQIHNASIEALFLRLCKLITFQLPAEHKTRSGNDATTAIIPLARRRYLAEIATQGRAESARIAQQARLAAAAHGYYLSLKALQDPHLPQPLDPYAADRTSLPADLSLRQLRDTYQITLESLTVESKRLLRLWPELLRAYRDEHYTYTVRGQPHQGNNYSESLSGLAIPKIALPKYENWGELLRFLLSENLPGHYPYTAGVYPYRRTDEEPARMFAGAGNPEQTNRRFHYLATGQKSTRLSTAFDPIVLYGENPDPRPDIYGRIGMSGVSIATLDDVKKLYSGFDLSDISTSVSMTINGPAPILLAWFFNAAIDQQIEKYLHASGQWQATETKIDAYFKDRPRPYYDGDLPSGHNRLGLQLLGITGRDMVDRETYERIRTDTLRSIRGTVQADILKEDQAQNECIFSVEFALQMMGDIQEYFIANHIRQYYSASISGYHIAEAGANPITQLAFTLANGFTLVEYYRARGMAVDDFAPNLSFFFSNSLDPEYAVIGRVARRIWARAMRHIYQASSRSQMLKYHIQTSGRSLQAQSIDFNDIRTTLEALYAIYDNCNSLHTNAYDEAVTTPTEHSVRRALAIQLIINRELGLNANQNVLQGSYIIEELTDLVEAAVYQEFERIAERGGVLSAMETWYQRLKIQEESLEYEHRKHVGKLSIVGVNTFAEETPAQTALAPPLIRASDSERDAQLKALAIFKHNHAAEAAHALQQLQNAVLTGGNTFAILMDVAQHCTLGQLTHALYTVGGQYRRRI